MNYYHAIKKATAFGKWGLLKLNKPATSKIRRFSQSYIRLSSDNVKDSKDILVITNNPTGPIDSDKYSNFSDSQITFSSKNEREFNSFKHRDDIAPFAFGDAKLKYYDWIFNYLLHDHQHRDRVEQRRSDFSWYMFEDVQYEKRRQFEMYFEQNLSWRRRSIEYASAHFIIQAPYPDLHKWSIVNAYEWGGNSTPWQLQSEILNDYSDRMMWWYDIVSFGIGRSAIVKFWPDVVPHNYDYYIWLDKREQHPTYPWFKAKQLDDTPVEDDEDDYSWAMRVIGDCAEHGVLDRTDFQELTESVLYYHLPRLQKEWDFKRRSWQNVLTGPDPYGERLISFLNNGEDSIDYHSAFREYDIQVLSDSWFNKTVFGVPHNKPEIGDMVQFKKVTLKNFLGNGLKRDIYRTAFNSKVMGLQFLNTLQDKSNWTIAPGVYEKPAFEKSLKNYWELIGLASLDAHIWTGMRLNTDYIRNEAFFKFNAGFIHWDAQGFEEDTVVANDYHLRSHFKMLSYREYTAYRPALESRRRSMWNVYLKKKIVFFDTVVKPYSIISIYAGISPQEIEFYLDQIGKSLIQVRDTLDLRLTLHKLVTTFQTLNFNSMFESIQFLQNSKTFSDLFLNFSILLKKITYSTPTLNALKECFGILWECGILAKDFWLNIKGSKTSKHRLHFKIILLLNFLTELTLKVSLGSLNTLINSCNNFVINMQLTNIVNVCGEQNVYKFNNSLTNYISKNPNWPSGIYSISADHFMNTLDPSSQTPKWLDKHKFNSHIWYKFFNNYGAYPQISGFDEQHIYFTVNTVNNQKLFVKQKHSGYIDFSFWYCIQNLGELPLQFEVEMITLAEDNPEIFGYDETRVIGWNSFVRSRSWTATSRLKLDIFEAEIDERAILPQQESQLVQQENYWKKASFKERFENTWLGVFVGGWFFWTLLSLTMFFIYWLMAPSEFDQIRFQYTDFMPNPFFTECMDLLMKEHQLWYTKDPNGFLIAPFSEWHSYWIKTSYSLEMLNYRYSFVDVSDLNLSVEPEYWAELEDYFGEEFCILNDIRYYPKTYNDEFYSQDRFYMLKHIDQTLRPMKYPEQLDLLETPFIYEIFSKDSGQSNGYLDTVKCAVTETLWTFQTKVLKPISTIIPNFISKLFYEKPIDWATLPQYFESIKDPLKMGAELPKSYSKILSEENPENLIFFEREVFNYRHPRNFINEYYNVMEQSIFYSQCGEYGKIFDIHEDDFAKTLEERVLEEITSQIAKQNKVLDACIDKIQFEDLKTALEYIHLRKYSEEAQADARIFLDMKQEAMDKARLEILGRQLIWGWDANSIDPEKLANDVQELWKNPPEQIKPEALKRAWIRGGVKSDFFRLIDQEWNYLECMSDCDDIVFKKVSKTMREAYENELRLHPREYPRGIEQSLIDMMREAAKQYNSKIY